MLFDILFTEPHSNPKILCSIFGENKIEALASFLATQGTLTDEELSKLSAEENKSWN